MWVLDSQRYWNSHTRGFSNHQKLLDHARKWPDVCLVTFNYDQLIEYALAGLGFVLSTMESYITHRQFKLVKLHGSIDWVDLVPSPPGVSTTAEPRALIEVAPQLQETAIFAVQSQQAPPEFREVLSNPHSPLPALAIPTLSKSRFVCPDSHVEVLRNLIPEVTRILMIGWRATEQHFLRILATGLRAQTHGLAVCGSQKYAEYALQNLQTAGVPGEYYADEGGFSEFIRSPRMKDFLRPVRID